MSKKKFDLIKNKKKVYIGAVGVALLAGVGVSIGYLSNGVSDDNKTSVVDKVVDKDKADKEEANDEKDKLVDSNLAENKYNDKSVMVTPEENASDSKANNSTTNESSSKDKGASSNSSTSKSESKPSNGSSSSSNSKPSSNSGSSSNSKPSNGSSSSSNSKPSNGGSSSNSKPSTGGSSNSGGTSKPEAHTHNWVAITQQIHHDEEGHWEEYVVTPAWTEEVPIYEEQAREICNGCGADITADPTTHNKNHMLNGEPGGWTTEYKKVQVGTNKVEHPAVTDKKWIVDKAAWTETVTTGYKCSGCGATK